MCSYMSCIQEAKKDACVIAILGNCEKSLSKHKGIIEYKFEKLIRKVLSFNIDEVTCSGIVNVH